MILRVIIAAAGIAFIPVCAASQEVLPDYPGSISKDFAVAGLKLGMSPSQVISALRARGDKVTLSPAACVKDEIASMKSHTYPAQRCISGILGRGRDEVRVEFTEDVPAHIGVMTASTIALIASSVTTEADRAAFTEQVLSKYPHPSVVRRFAEARAEALWCNRHDLQVQHCDRNYGSADQQLWLCNGNCSYVWLELKDIATTDARIAARRSYVQRQTTTKVDL